MIDKLKLLFKDTVIYGVSSILARALNYILVPLYANILLTAENGIHALIYANIAFLNILFTYGQETAYMKFASEQTEASPTQKSYFSTAMGSLSISAIAFSTLIAIFAKELALLMGLEADAAIYVQYAALILFLDTIIVVPLANLRLERKAVQFAMVKLLGVGITVVSTVLFITVYKFGLHGAFWGNILGSALVFVLLIPEMFRNFTKGSWAFWKEMIWLGLPYVPSGLMGLFVRLVDRNVLMHVPDATFQRLYGGTITNTEVVGIYGRVVAFGILVQLLVQIFRFAWQPFFLQHAAEKEAKKLFSQVFTLTTVGMTALIVGASLVVPDLIQVHYFGKVYLLPPNFWIGLSVLPIVFFGSLFEMMSVNLSAGLLIEKRTQVLPIISGIGALATIVLCIWLSNEYGMMGAAISATSGLFLMATAMAYYSLKYYPNSYEWGKIFGVILVGAAFTAWAQMIESSLVLDLLFFVGFTALGGLLFRREVKSVLKTVRPTKS